MSFNSPYWGLFSFSWWLHHIRLTIHPFWPPIVSLMEAEGPEPLLIDCEPLVKSVKYWSYINPFSSELLIDQCDSKSHHCRWATTTVIILAGVMPLIQIHQVIQVQYYICKFGCSLEMATQDLSFSIHRMGSQTDADQQNRALFQQLNVAFSQSGCIHKTSFKNLT